MQGHRTATDRHACCFRQVPTEQVVHQDPLAPPSHEMCQLSLWWVPPCCASWKFECGNPYALAFFASNAHNLASKSAEEVAEGQHCDSSWERQGPLRREERGKVLVGQGGEGSVGQGGDGCQPAMLRKYSQKPERLVAYHALAETSPQFGRNASPQTWEQHANGRRSV